VLCAQAHRGCRARMQMPYTGPVLGRATTTMCLGTCDVGAQRWSSCNLQTVTMQGSVLCCVVCSPVINPMSHVRLLYGVIMAPAWTMQQYQ
jgi:hypothetical protein